MIITSNPARNLFSPLLEKIKTENIDVISINVQTTGLNYDTDNVLQIGAVKHKMDSDGQLVEIETFNEYVQCLQPIPKAITEINGITNDMVEGADPISIVLRKFATFCGNRFVALFYNVPFGISWLKWGHIMYGIPFEPVETLDVYRIVQDVYGASRDSLKLCSIVEDINLDVEGNYHDALHDARCIGLVFNHFRDKFAEIIKMFPQGADVPQIINITRARNVDNAPIWNIRCRFYGNIILDPYAGTFSNEFDCFERLDVNQLELLVLEYFNKLSLRDITW